MRFDISIHSRDAIKLKCPSGFTLAFISQKYKKRVRDGYLIRMDLFEVIYYVLKDKKFDVHVEPEVYEAVEKIKTMIRVSGRNGMMYIVPNKLQGDMKAETVPIKDFVSTSNHVLDQWAKKYMLLKDVNHDMIKEYEKLRDYQIEGVEYLLEHPSTLLADEMGLGKSFTSLVALDVLMRQGIVHKALIVLQGGSKYSFADEIKKQFEGISGSIVKDFVIIDKGNKEMKEKLKAPVVLLSYALLRKKTNFEKVLEYDFDLMMCDEVQKIKNYKSKSHKAIVLIKSPFRWALTGTPIENNPIDLFSIMRFINSDTFSSFNQFAQKYIVYKKIHIKKFNKDVQVPAKFIRQDELHRIMRSTVMLRRRKSDHLTELPPYITKTHVVGLKEKQRWMYNQIKKHILDIKNIPEEDIFSEITYLREVCDSTELIDPDIQESSKVEALIDIINSTDGKVLVFTQWEKMLDIIVGELKKKEIKYLRAVGSMSSKNKQNTVKKFNDSEDVRILVATDCLSSAFNIQSANYIINFDLPWKPSTLVQRYSRAHRMGQTKVVEVINIVAMNTIERHVMDKITEKAEIINNIIDGKVTDVEGLFKNIDDILEHI